LGTLALMAQERGNPFELIDRLPASERMQVAPGITGNPFDIYPDAGIAISAKPVAARGAEIAVAPGVAVEGAPTIISPTDPNVGKGSMLAIHILLWVLAASLWLLFGGLLRQCLAATVNDGIMTQLYTRRSGGQLGALWMCYIFFFLAGGHYFHLFALNHDISIGQGIWGSWLTYALGIAAAVGLKHWVLFFYARIFPVRKEVSRYAFVLMVFSILAGHVIMPINLLASYAPPEWQMTFLYAGVVVFSLIYLLHLLRGGFIASRLIGSRPVHILLYICAIEIAPLLLIYRYLSDNILI
jgi:hypothetical protein